MSSHSSLSVFLTISAVLLTLQAPALAEEVQPVSQGDAVTPAASMTGTVQVIQQAPMVQTPQPAALVAADYLDIQVQPGALKAGYQQYNLTLNNKQPRHLEILQVEVVNGLAEDAYQRILQEKAQAKKRRTGSLLRGLGTIAGAATSFVPYAGGVGSLVAYQAVGAGSNVAYAAASVAENTPGQGSDYTGRIMQRANNIFLGPNQPFQCQAVVANGQSPIVRVLFKDLQTNQILDLQK